MSKEECEDYEASLKDFSILKFIVKRVTPNESKYVNMGITCKIERISSSTSFEVKEDLKIIQNHITYDNWDGRSPSNSINTFTVAQYLKRYSRGIFDFKNSLVDFKEDLVKLKSIKYKSKKLDSLIEKIKEEIKNTEEAVIFLNKYTINE